MKQRKICVYVILCSCADGAYVGQTIQSLSTRFSAIKSTARSAIPSNGGMTAISKAIRAHGPQNFSIMALKDGLTQLQADRWERHFIKTMNTLVPCGWNTQAGGDLTYTLSRYGRKRISDGLYRYELK